MRPEQIDALARSWKFRPVPTLSLPDWADKNRRLSAMSSAISGQWLTSRFEIARGPMMATHEPGVKKLSCMFATQIAKSELILNLIAYIIANDPAPTLLILPKDDAARQFAKERLQPMIRATPALLNIFGSPNRTRNESLTYREFPGGYLAIESSNSPTNLAMRAIRFVLADEIDKYDATRSEGDPLALAAARMATFDNALMVQCCSPTFENESRIAAAYDQSDQRQAFVACPHCGHEQTMEFFTTPGAACVEWTKGEDGEHFPATAGLICSSCGVVWSEAERLKMVTTAHAIRWKQTRPFECCGVEQTPSQWHWDEANQVGRALCEKCGTQAVSNAHAGFTASRLYSPKTTVAQIAEQWIASKDDIESRQAFTNTVLARTFSARAGNPVPESEYAARREKYGDKLDRRILRLLCGVDNQDDRLECHVLGVAYPEEWWSVHYEVLRGDLSGPAIWRQLYEFLRSTWPHPHGDLPISATCIDSGGHFTQHIYDFCRARRPSENIWAIKGSSWSRPGDPTWIIPRQRINRDFGFKPQLINVDAAKDYMRQVLLTNEPGPGFLHLPMECDDAWLAQLFTSETPVYEKKNGVTTRRWTQRKGAANEVWDTTIYAYAAYCGMKAVRGFSLERDIANLVKKGIQYD